jgi:hypothetical protein
MHHFKFFIISLTVTLASCWPDFYLYNTANPAKEKKVSAPLVSRYCQNKNSFLKSFQKIYILEPYKQNVLVTTKSFLLSMAF